MTTKTKEEERIVRLAKKMADAFDASLLVEVSRKYYVKYKLSDGTWSPERQCAYLDWLRYKFDPTCQTRVEE